MAGVRGRFPGRPSFKASNLRRKRVRHHRHADSKPDHVMAAENICKGFVTFNQTFGDSDEDDQEFHGFTDDQLVVFQDKASEERCRIQKALQLPQNQRFAALQPKQLLAEATAKIANRQLKDSSTSRAKRSKKGNEEVDKKKKKMPEAKTTTCTTKKQQTKLGGVKSQKEAVVEKEVAVVEQQQKKVLIRPSKLGNFGSVSPIIGGSFSGEREKGKRQWKPSFKMQQQTTQVFGKSADTPIKKSISQYANAVSSKLDMDVNSSTSSTAVEEKEDRMQQKIQRILASQWDSRLRKVDNKFVKTSRIIDGPDSCASPEHISGPTRPVLRESKLVLNQKLLERLRKPSQQVEFYQAIQRSMQSADKTPPKLVEGLANINPAGTALVEQGDKLDPRGSTEKRTEKLSESSSKSSGSKPSNRMPGNIVCGICGAVRYYSFILQAKKFGTFSCEPCRKFISRTIRRCKPSEASDEELFPCVSGTGMCVVPPVLRTNPNAPRKKGDQDVRCQACWLKLCLIGYNLDAELYDRLRAHLPLVFHDLLPEAANRGKTQALLSHRGEILEFNRQVPLSRPLFDGFGGTADKQLLTCERLTEAKKQKSGKASHVVHERLPNGWSKKAVKRLTGVLKGKWDMYLITPDQTTLRSATDLKLYIAKSGAVIDSNIVNFSLPKKTAKADKVFNVLESKSQPQKAVIKDAASEVNKVKAVADEGEEEVVKVKKVHTPRTKTVFTLPKSSRRETKVPLKYRNEPEPVKTTPKVQKAKKKEEVEEMEVQVEDEEEPSVVAKVQTDEELQEAIDKESAVVAVKSEPTMSYSKRMQQLSTIGVGTFSIDKETVRGMSSGRFTKRVKMRRCGICKGCHATNCGQCIPCQDMLKNGGPGLLKQACVERRCTDPKMPGMPAMSTFKTANDLKRKYIKTALHHHKSPLKKPLLDDPEEEPSFSSSSSEEEIEEEIVVEVKEKKSPERSLERPKMSYSALIAMAIQNSAKQRATLSSIYEYVQETFPYFKKIDKTGWQNSIRHNLSIQKAFYRTKSTNAKGAGYWQLDPKVSTGSFKKVRKVQKDSSFWEPDPDTFKDTSLNSSSSSSQHNVLEETKKSPAVVIPIKKPEDSEENNRRLSVEEFVEMGLLGTTPESKTKVDDESKKTKKKKLVLMSPRAKLSPYAGSMDYWEQYDPEKVSLTGQSVVTTESLPVESLCFLCGSAGEEEMMYCHSCCEPYHPFCLGQDELPQNVEAEKEWVCRRCAVCQVCGQPDGSRMRCGKCSRAFHEDCLQPSQRKMVAEQTAWMCGQCLRCKSCGKADVAHFDQGLPLCDVCCLQKKKGSYCPLCTGCYDDNDYESRMMECAQCGGWVHAKCENVDAEKYQILSYLPDTVEYICKKCSPIESLWMSAVMGEMKAGQKLLLDSLMELKCAKPFVKHDKVQEEIEVEKAKRKLDFDLVTKNCQVSLKNVDHLLVKKINLHPEIRACSVPLKDVKNHSWWGSKVRSLNVEDASFEPQESESVKQSTPIKDQSWEEEEKDQSLEEEETDQSLEEEHQSLEDSLDLSTMLENVEKDEYKSVLAFHLALKKVLSSTYIKGPLKDKQRCDFYTAYVGQLSSIFPWFDVRKPLARFEPQTIEEALVIAPHKDHIYASPALLCEYNKSPHKKTKRPLLALDYRLCQFCGQLGDKSHETSGRLIYYRQNEWVHINCALWSSEVYEEVDGSLQQVSQALNRASKLNCTVCLKKGATIGCCHEYCKENYHFECGLAAKAVYKDDKTVYCKKHKELYAFKGDQKHFKINRTVHIDLELEYRKRLKPVDLRTIKCSIGSLTIESLGYIRQVSDTKEALVPIGFSCSRWFWSSLDPSRRVKYYCRTKLVTPVKCANDLHSLNLTIDHDDTTEVEVERELKVFKKLVRQVELEQAKKVRVNFLPPFAISSWFKHISYADLHEDEEVEEDDSPDKTRDNEDLMDFGHQDLIQNDDDDLISAILKDSNFEQELDKGAGGEVDEKMLNQEEVETTRTWFNQNKLKKLSEVSVQVNLPYDKTNFEMDAINDDNVDDSNSYCTDFSTEEEDIPEEEESKIMDIDQEEDSSSIDSSDILSYVTENMEKLNNMNEMEIINKILAMSDQDDQEDMEPNEKKEHVNNNDNQCRSKENTPQKLDLSQLDGNNDEDECNNPDAGSPRKDFSIAGLLSPPPDLQSQQGGGEARPLLQPKTAASAPGPSMMMNNVYVQHLPAPDMAKPFVESFQQTTGRPLQYVTSISGLPQVRTFSPTFITAQGQFVHQQHPGILQAQQQHPGILQAQQPQHQALSYAMTPQGFILNSQPNYINFAPNAGPNTIQAQPIIYQNAPFQSYSYQPYNIQPPPSLPPAVNSGQPRGVARVQPQPAKLDPIKALSTMASQPIQSATNQLSITHGAGRSAGPLFDAGKDRQRSVGTQAKIGGPLKILTPRPWKGSGGESSTSTVQQQLTVPLPPLSGSVSSGVSAASSSRPSSTQSASMDKHAGESRCQTPKSTIEEDHSYCSSPEPSQNMPFAARPTPSEETSIKITFKNHPEALKVHHVSIKDGGGRIDPKTAFVSMKAKTKATRKATNKAAALIVPLANSEIIHSQDQFVNELCINSNERPLDVVKVEPDEPDGLDEGPQIIYELTSDDGFRQESRDVDGLWQKVFEAVQEARIQHGLDPMAFNPLGQTGHQMLGLCHSALQYLLEQLPGAKSAERYSFKHHRQTRPQEPLKENPTGCARSEGFKDRKPLDMFSWLASRHRKKPHPAASNKKPTTATKIVEIPEMEVNLSNRRATSLDLPMAMRFRHLAKNAKEAVGVFSSYIHGRGLFCKREIQAGEMVIEYAGEEIRAMLTDKREKHYESRGIGCYMFKIDDETVVDATMKGNAARFINHSCDPNCYSKIVDVLGKKHIIIFANRKILPGEELTYDYKFPIEDVKIPCTCGARRCRKYMN